ncbi:extracellular solute-binding protein family 3 [Nitrosococcus halophilus Nc 4]|uniref:Extracellular solute-binding protein family 3 n=1 Tax=Nitrosococcus halophilus (strain Nc4) TaxID=472759 RepID=D5C3H0_NITHN|nr:extracellular solute-binding protein family 3 [Nitrosococcus halophilus Nc 4]
MGEHVKKIFVVFWIALLAIAPDLSQGVEGSKEKVLRVCADPSNLPYSDRQQGGFENKIAELFAKDLGWDLEYVWFPQRIGFIRNTLKKPVPTEKRYRCDLVLGVPTGYDLVATTKPYYRSTYTMVYRKKSGLDLKSVQDIATLRQERGKHLKVAVFDRTPGVDLLVKYRILDQALPYQLQSGDVEAYHGQILETDLLEGKFDVALIWGPIAGYFAAKSPESLVLIPLHSEPNIRLEYAVSMGVRRGEAAWKATVQDFLDRKKEQIDAILTDYHIPLLRIYENPIDSFAPSLPLPSFKTVVLYSSCAHLTSRRSLSGRCLRARSHDKREDLGVSRARQKLIFSEKTIIKQLRALGEKEGIKIASYLTTRKEGLRPPVSEEGGEGGPPPSSPLPSSGNTIPCPFSRA